MNTTSNIAKDQVELGDLRTLARDAAVQFLYRCESQKLFFFADNHFHSFISHLQITGDTATRARELAKGVLDQLQELDAVIAKASQNWKVERMSVLDRAIIRVATYELLESKTPPKVVLNEAIELAKKYGTAESGAFVNGILDRLVKERPA